MPTNPLNIDDIVDYRAEYSSIINDCKISGNNLTGLCPFHKDTNNSFSVDLKTGKWHCFSEDEGGNFVSFWAKLHGISTGDAYKAILKKYHVAQDKPKTKKEATGEPTSYAPYTIEQYSFEKRLPVEYLKDTCHLSTKRERNGGTPYLDIPYLNEAGIEATSRRRFGNKDFRWKYGSRGKIGLYGEWRIEEIRKAGYVVLVEGESDTHSLWYMGIPAIGVPGASMFKPHHGVILGGLKVYLHQEPDKGGTTFISKVCRGLRDGGFIGEVYSWACHQIDGTKDPSDLYLKYGKIEATSLIKEALKNAVPIDLKEDQIPEAIPGAPINLRQPGGWYVTEKGILILDEKCGNVICVCRTPIILTKRLSNIDTREEKIEIAFLRDSQWHTAIYPRSTIFNSRSITSLADLGCTITSENAKQVVRFLGELEAENIDIIPKTDATGTFGWQPGKRFLPGHADGITLDIDLSQRGMAAAYCQNGTYDRWRAHMTPHRERDKFRFILASSFAAPLLRIVKQRIFFIYNWGGSKGGKTAALKAALSAWGDPERLMVNFNATQVGLERTASFYCDLPLGIDERQLAGNNQGALEKIVYMIASGTGKLRGAKGGGLQTIHQWRTVALATGEEPLSTDTTQTGVSTRVLEIYGGPFDNEQDAGLMHQQAVMDCGWAGPAFIDRLLQTDERQIVDAYSTLQQFVRGLSNGKNGSHISGISAVALADAMIDSWIFHPEEAGARDVLGILEFSWDKARRMAANIMLEQVESNCTDVNENATQFVLDWILSNKAYFGFNTSGTCFGIVNEQESTVYIFPSIFSQALSKAGYSPRKTLKHLADRGLIDVSTEKSGKKTYSVPRRYGGKTARFVVFHLDHLERTAAQSESISDYPELTGPDADFPADWDQNELCAP